MERAEQANYVLQRRLEDRLYSSFVRMMDATKTDF